MKTKHIVFIMACIAAFCIICILAFKNFEPNTKTAKIYKDGILIKTIELSSLESAEEFIVKSEDGKHENIILAEQDGISVKSASCPDKLCVGQGKIKNSSAPIVCLPNHVVIKIENNADNDADAVSLAERKKRK